MIIIEQHLKPEGVLTVYEDGEQILLPYLVDKAGEEYVELFPNDLEITGV